MKILHISSWDSRGGAAIAASRLHCQLLEEGVDSEMLVVHSRGKIPKVRKLSKCFRNYLSEIVEYWVRKLTKWAHDPDYFVHSINLIPNNLLAEIERINPDLVHLHWVGGGMLRIEDLPKIQKPLVWTLHDMWPLCGSEHCNTNDSEPWSQANGVVTNSRSLSANLSKWTQRRKLKAWSEVSLVLVSPSDWMNRCAQRSLLWQGREMVHFQTIPNGLETSVFTPTVRSQAGEKKVKPLVLFGALDLEDFIKGGDLLQSILNEASRRGLDFEIGTFGAGELKLSTDYFIRHFGMIDDWAELVRLYNMADVVLVPSRMESFGQTASEALACGTPVVCFDTTGLRDIVDHKKNGYLATPFLIKDFVDGVEWVLSPENTASCSAHARSKVCNVFDTRTTAAAYLSLYRSILKRS